MHAYLIMAGLKTVFFLVEQYFKNIIIRIDSISGVSKGLLRVLQHTLTSLSSKRIEYQVAVAAMPSLPEHHTKPHLLRSVQFSCFSLRFRILEV